MPAIELATTIIINKTPKGTPVVNANMYYANEIVGILKHLGGNKNYQHDKRNTSVPEVAGRVTAYNYLEWALVCVSAAVLSADGNCQVGHNAPIILIHLGHFTSAHTYSSLFAVDTIKLHYATLYYSLEKGFMHLGSTMFFSCPKEGRSVQRFLVALNHFLQIRSDLIQSI